MPARSGFRGAGPRSQTCFVLETVMQKIFRYVFLGVLGLVVLNTSTCAQLVDQFNPPDEDCCPRIEAIG
jgi:hypothetical protein